MDLFADAGRGAPFDNLSPPDRITTRRWTGAVGQRLNKGREFALCLERKELLLGLGCTYISWWGWCLGFQGRLGALPLLGHNSIEFWKGFAYSPPRPDLSEKHTLQFLEYGLKDYSYIAQGLPHDIYESRFMSSSAIFDCQYVRGVPAAEMAARPLTWLAYCDIPKLYHESQMYLTEADILYAHLSVEDICGKPLSMLTIRGVQVSPEGRMILIQRRMASGEKIGQRPGLRLLSSTYIM